MKPKICVVGSANIDQVSYVKRTPSDGETVFGESYQMGFGGKGANQAVMAGILGAEVYVIACLGSDVYRDMTIENFKNNDVEVMIQEIENLFRRMVFTDGGEGANVDKDDCRFNVFTFVQIMVLLFFTNELDDALIDIHLEDVVFLNRL